MTVVGMRSGYLLETFLFQACCVLRCSYAFIAPIAFPCIWESKYVRLNLFPRYCLQVQLGVQVEREKCINKQHSGSLLVYRGERGGGGVTMIDKGH